jgi:vitamin B12 transporter
MKSTTHKFPLAVFSLLTTLLTAQPALADNITHHDDKHLAEWYFEDELVETATRSPKPISQVAENVTIINAEDIEAMHAHTLAEVLDRQPGVFISFFGQDFLGDSNINLLGSRRHHVLLLLDGMRLNINSGGAALTNFIPLGIIERIEIIKGAASSTWGSALGGVINIITKHVGKTDDPTGNIAISYGEQNSRDLSADVAGRVKALGYYFHGGNINSDGLRLDRYSDRNSVYGKMQLQLYSKSSLTATLGYSDPFNKTLNWKDAWGISDLNLSTDVENRNFWGSLFFDTKITQQLILHLSGQHYYNTFSTNYNSLGTGRGGSWGELIFAEKWKDEVNSFISRLTWKNESVIANFGFESSRSKMTYMNQSGIFFKGPSTTEEQPVTEDRHGAYSNISYIKGFFSITPGLRYDNHSNSKESINPSLGITYQLFSDALFRGSIARGFSAPYLAASSHSPDLNPENIWAYQAGVETDRIPSLHCKGSIFHHDIKDAWNFLMVPWTNTGTSQSNGFSLEIKTNTYNNVNLTGNFTYIKEKNKSISTSISTSTWKDDETYIGNLILSYSNNNLRAELAGHYYWLSNYEQGEAPMHGTFLWDFLIAKNFASSFLNGEIYLKGHNIFNEEQYFDVEYPNPERWLEAGLAFKF